MSSPVLFAFLLAVVPPASPRSLSLEILDRIPDAPLPGQGLPPAPDPPRPSLARTYDLPADPEDPLDQAAEGLRISCRRPGTAPAPPR